MNKSQQLDVMRLRAKKKVAELMKQHEASWRGTPPIIKEKNYGDNSTNTNDK